MAVKLEAFLDEYQKALDEGLAGAFVGAGMSVPAGFVDWKELLRETAAELDLNVDEETDLIALAQYYVNHSRSRGRINQKLMDEYTKDSAPAENHHLLAGLPLVAIWTTNYDHLIEDAFKAAHKRVDKKVVQEDLALALPKRDVVIYKMHGDIDRPNEAVLTKVDYEEYDRTRQLFSIQLRGDLLSKTLMFLGYGFNDPNVHYILARIRVLMGQNPKTHYWITRDAAKDPRATERDRKLQRHRIEDLKTYGIRTVLIDDYSRITEILRELNKRVNRKNVFFSGSAYEYAPLGRDRVLALLRRLGGTLIDEGFNLVSGMGLGVGDAVAMGAIEAVYRQSGHHLDGRTTLRPFPQVPPTGSTPAEFKTRYREEMLGRTRSAVFVLGNKLDSTTGAVVPGDGVRQEYEIARRFGVIPIPIGATGHVAKDLSKEVLADLDAIFGSHARAVATHLSVLADPTAEDDELLRAVVATLKILAPK